MQNRTKVFVLMLTSRADEADKIRGFSKVLMTISPSHLVWELEVRLGAILKRQRLVTTSEKQRLTFEKLVIDPESGR